jgi:ribosomal protein S12 methylthiotransferase accessory factor
MSRLRLSPAASVTPTGGTVLLRSDLGTFQLDGDDVRVFLERMLPLLDGSRDAAAVAAELPDYSGPSVRSLLELLRQRGLVEEVAEAVAEGDAAGAEAAAASGRRAAQERFFQAWERPDASARLAATRLLVLGAAPWGTVAAIELAAAGVGSIHLLDDGTVTADDVLAVRSWQDGDVGRPRREAVAAAVARAAADCRFTSAPAATVPGGLEVAAEGPWDLLLTGLAADDLHLLRHAAEWAHRQGVPSLHGHLDGFEAWIGPGVVPGETACWNCFRLRRLANAPAPLPAHQLDAAQLAAPGPPRARAYLAPMAAQAGSALATEALKLLVGLVPPRVNGRVFIHDLIDGKAAYHTVLRLPWCEVCGGAARAGGRRPRTPGRRGGAVPAEEAPDGDGGDETAEPPAAPSALGAVRTVEALREMLADWIGDKVGVVRALADAGATTPFSLPFTASATTANYTEGRPRHAQLFQVGAGKGLTPVAAHLSAFGEAIERYSAARYQESELRVASFAELGDEAFDPRRLGLYAEEQYRRPGFPFARFSPDTPLRWTRGRWLDDGAPVWVPAFAAYFDFQAPAGEYLCEVSSNGLAAGSDDDDAALRALYELVERDNFLLTWLCRLPARRLELDASVDPGVHEVVRQLAEQALAVELYLLDPGVAIPTVLCLGLGDGVRWPGTIASLATHPDPAQAAAKAVLEQAHVAPYLAGLMRSHRIPSTPEEVRTLEDHALYYVPPARRSAFDFLGRQAAAEPVGRLARLEEPLHASCVERLAAAGVRVAVVDVTSPDVAAASPFRVARALGTDLLPIHFGYERRRLGNRRLRQRLGDHEPHPEPHPLA